MRQWSSTAPRPFWPGFCATRSSIWRRPVRWGCTRDCRAAGSAASRPRPQWLHYPGHFVRAQLVHHHGVAREQFRGEERVVVCQWPPGACPTQRWPLSDRPRVGVMSVVAEVSSRKIRRPVASAGCSAAWSWAPPGWHARAGPTGITPRAFDQAPAPPAPAVARAEEPGTGARGCTAPRTYLAELAEPLSRSRYIERADAKACCNVLEQPPCANTRSRRSCAKGLAASPRHGAHLQIGLGSHLSHPGSRALFAGQGAFALVT